MAAHGRRIKLTQRDKVPIRWQAPEVLLQFIYLRESDVWSYGMLMSEIYNDGKKPFHGIPNAQIRKNTVKDDVVAPTAPKEKFIHRIQNGTIK
ncbi:hypothetical protein KIN20_007638, partial [Parelaphostrongylus tenuis]